MAKKKRRLGLRITLAVLLVLVIGISGVAYWQWNTIQAVVDSQKYSSEERRIRLNEQETALLNRISEELPEIQVKPLSEEDAKLLQDGEMTPEEAVSLITGKPVKHPEENPKANVQPQVPEAVETETSNLENLLAQIYVLKASFNGQLESMVAQAKQDAINGKGQVTKTNIAKKYIGRAAGLEGQCDSKMESLLSQIEAELKKTGGDTGIVNEIRAAYMAEKSAKKAELMDRYR